jgi:hypothetical protein
MSGATADRIARDLLEVSIAQVWAASAAMSGAGQARAEDRLLDALVGASSGNTRGVFEIPACRRTRSKEVELR